MKTMLQIIFFPILLAVGIFEPWKIYQAGQLAWNAKQVPFQRNAADIEKLDSANLERSNQIAQLQTKLLSAMQFHELMRLRGEIGPLRDAAAETEALRNQNERLRLIFAPPDPSHILAHWSKDQLANAGLSDLISALETMLWTFSRNDPQAFLQVVTPTSIRVQGWNTNGPPNAKLAHTTQNFYESVAPATGFSVIYDSVDRVFAWGGVRIVGVYFEGEQRNHYFIISHQTDGQWKLLSIANDAYDEGGPVGNGQWP